MTTTPSFSQPVPAIGMRDLDQLAPVIFGYPVAWDAYISELEQRCLRILDEGHLPVVAVIGADRYLAWCAANEVNPRGFDSVHAFARFQIDSGLGTVYQSDLRAIIRTDEVLREVERLAALRHGPQNVSLVLSDALSVAETLVATIESILPANARLRITQYGASADGDRVCDITTSNDVEDEPFPGNLYEMVKSELALALITTGALACECARGDEWGYMIWSLDVREAVALDRRDAALFVLQKPALVPDNVDPMSSVDAPVIVPSDGDLNPSQEG